MTDAGQSAYPAQSGASPATPGALRLIATEEAFAPVEYVTEFLKMAATKDDTPTRYLKMYYSKQELVRQLTDLDYRLVEMDKYGIDMHLLSIASPGVQVFDADVGSSLAALANDALAAAIGRNPTRFAGLGAVAPQSPERAAREIDRCMNELNLNGIIINSHTQGEFLDDPKFWPIFEAAVACDAPIYLHPAFPAPSMIEPYSQYGMMGALWGFGADTSLHVVRMIMGGVFDAFPKLKIVLGHLGEGMAFWLGRLDNRYQNIVNRGGLEPLGMKKLQRLPSEYFATNFWSTTSGMMTMPPFDLVLKMFGPDRLMFAVDYPFEQTAEAAAFARALDLPDEVLHKVAHGTAESLFRIAPQ